MGVIQRQSIKNFFSSYMGVLIGFLNVLVIQPRFLTPEELGLTRVLYSFSLLLSTFVPLGSANIIIRYFPHFRNPEKKHHGFFGFIIAVSLIGFVFTVLLLLLGKNYIMAQYMEKSPMFADFFLYVFPLLFFLTFITQLNLYCYSLYKTTVPVFLNDVVSRLMVIGVVSLYYLKLFPLQTFITLFVSVYALQVLMQMVYIYYEEKPGFKIDLPKFKSVGWNNMFGYAAVVWLASVSSTGLKELATVVLGSKISLAQVGIYVVASFIPTLIEVPLGALDKIATFNISSALAQKRYDTVKEIYSRSARYLLLIGGWLFLLINGNINSLLEILPEKYRGGGEIVFILSFGTLFNMATGLNSQILFYSEKFYYGALLMIGAVIVNMSLLLWLIPLYGVIGAAMATAFSGMLMNSVSTFIVYRTFKIHPFEILTIKSLILLAGVGLLDHVVPHLSNKIIDVLVHSSIITSTVFILVYILKFLPEMNQIIDDFLKKRRK